MKTKDSGAERGGAGGDENEGDEGDEVIAEDNVEELLLSDECGCELELPEADFGLAICASSVPTVELFVIPSISMSDDRYKCHYVLALQKILSWP